MAGTTKSVTRIVHAYVRELARTYRVSHAVLFGSHARGAARRNSDIDLAIFLDEPVQGRKLAIMRKMSALAWQIDPRIEAIPFAAKEFRATDATSLVAEIVRCGKVMYPAA